MIISFIKVTLRNLYREKSYALINISGLSLAIASCMILGLHLRSELTYDQHNILYKQIFRVAHESDFFGRKGSSALTSESLEPTLIEAYPEIKGYVRITPPERSVFKYKEKSFSWEKVSAADNSIFKVFTHDIIFGDPETALIDPSSVAVSESFAKKYFGDENPIGKTITRDQQAYKITLVFADLPENTHLKYDAILSFNAKDPGSASSARVTIGGGGGMEGMSVNRLVYTYLLMPRGYDEKEFREISSYYYTKHSIDKNLKESWRLQPLADIHLHSDLEQDQPAANKFALYGFTAVAAFILLVACINYTNLATARAAKRIKEVGMRKILGAGRTQLMFQFLVEAIVFSLIALLFGLLLVEIVLNLTEINQLLGKTLELNLLNDAKLAGWLLILGFSVGLVSGIYPALYLSSIGPMSALMVGSQTGKGSVRLRKILVLIQFIITVGVISCILIMALQMRYIFQKPIGFKKENRVAVTLHGAKNIKKIPTIKTELLKNSNILGISAISTMIGRPTMKLMTAMKNDQGVVGKNMETNMILVDKDFMKVMGMQLVKGRDFSKRLLTDGGKTCVVNETLAKTMGWEEPIGRRTMFGKVIGVIKDFHFASLHNPVEPFILGLFDDSNLPIDQERYLILHISGDEISRTIKFLEEKFMEYDPGHAFEYEFLDGTLDALYLSEQNLMKLTAIFAGICVLISCLGLSGLTAFTTEQRTREIGVRKVFGATTWQIIGMLLRNIFILISGGAVIASPAAYFAMDEWMAGFAYHADINPVVYLLSALLVAGVAFLTVSLQSYRAARANPVEALRYE